MRFGNYNEVVVGSSLPALIYAYLNHLPIVYTTAPFFEFFERLSPTADLSPFCLPPTNLSLQTMNGERSVGFSKEELWERIMFVLGMLGLNLSINNTSGISVQGNEMVLKTGVSSHSLSFDRATIFDLRGVTGIDAIRSNKTHPVSVYDFFDAPFHRSKKGVDLIELPNPPIDLWLSQDQNYVRFLTAKYDLTEERLLGNMYTEANLRIIVQRFLDKHFGISKRVLNEKKRRDKAIVTLVERFIVPKLDRVSCDRQDIVFNYSSEDEIIKTREPDPRSFKMMKNL